MANIEEQHGGFKVRWVRRTAAGRQHSGSAWCATHAEAVKLQDAVTANGDLIPDPLTLRDLGLEAHAAMVDPKFVLMLWDGLHDPGRPTDREKVEWVEHMFRVLKSAYNNS